MEWLKLLIPLIAVAVWILSHLAGNQQNQRRQAPRPQPPFDPDQEPRHPGRAASELERFLEDVKRRKEMEQVPEAILIAEEVAPPRKAPPPLPRPVEQRRKSVPIGVKPPQRRRELAALVQPLPVTPAPTSRTVTMPSSAVAEVQAPQATQAPPPPPQALHRPEALPTKASKSEAVKLVQHLLRNRQALAGAFLLREILDKPLSKRRR
jgi:hypothetical protein